MRKLEAHIAKLKERLTAKNGEDKSKRKSCPQSSDNEGSGLELGASLSDPESPGAEKALRLIKTSKPPPPKSNGFGSTSPILPSSKKRKSSQSTASTFSQPTSTTDKPVVDEPKGQKAKRRSSVRLAEANKASNKSKAISLLFQSVSFKQGSSKSNQQNPPGDDGIEDTIPTKSSTNTKENTAAPKKRKVRLNKKPT